MLLKMELISVWYGKNDFKNQADHIAIDKVRELAKGKKAIGTTGRGIGPAYEDKVARRALRVADLFEARQPKEGAILAEISGQIEYQMFVLAR